jgi:methylmalonyl-CoA mutase N-terminal domain/subunit
MGGMIAAIEKGYPQKEIAESSYQFQRAVEEKRKIIVGVNEFITGQEPIPVLVIDERVREAQAGKLKRLRETRNQRRVSDTLRALERGARGDHNLMPLILDCVRVYATLGEICDTLRGVFGAYEEVSVL